MEPIVLTVEMMVVLGVLALTVTLFVTEVFRIDVTAILMMVLLGMLSQFPGLGGLADERHLFAGFSSNAVISIIAVMIIGAGLDRTGLMRQGGGGHPALWRADRGADHPDHIGHGGGDFLVHAERGRGGAVPAGGQPDFGAHRAAAVAVADANGVFARFWAGR